MKKSKFLSAALVAALGISGILTGCSSEGDSEKTGGKGASNELVVYSPNPIEFNEPLVKEFEDETGIKVEVISAGAGELLKRIESEGENPLGDVMWGGSLSSLEPFTDHFEKYQSKNEDKVIDEYKNEDGYITRFSLVPSVIMVNKNLAGDMKIEGYEDLLNKKLKGKIAFADPSKSSSSFEQVINQLYAMGNGDPEKGWDYVGKLIGNLDHKLLSGSSAVYKGVADGEYSVGLTFEEPVVNYMNDGAPVDIVYPKEGTIVKPDGVVIIKGANNLENAKKFVDFITNEESQTLVANELNRRPILSTVQIKEDIGMKPLKDIHLIEDDQEWSNKNKEIILDKFKDIFTSN
ncbi:ABC transporter substrate-binding protein [Fictibacillus phosphorivorans]|uniref:ABC transporter substrate-binding protein n=1 Tax=Fictibacillus phosphorivorans TaxID=1221500 RepID=UPI00203E5B97|nr:ABC transporter substrate-binding protein [Fictibacillus phosphorivorans]MCM3718087.1 ABC transporter substrate-binding protein [Fictibacillus phosphorivorans]MCM3775714.1 ABC transporter substrate-binding protein [Fictibacillus phosphorivorans]